MEQTFVFAFGIVLFPSGILSRVRSQQHRRRSTLGTCTRVLNHQCAMKSWTRTTQPSVLPQCTGDSCSFSCVVSPPDPGPAVKSSNASRTEEVAASKVSACTDPLPSELTSSQIKKVLLDDSSGLVAHTASVPGEWMTVGDFDYHFDCRPCPHLNSYRPFSLTFI